MKLTAPEGFELLCRTGYAIPFMHSETKRTGAVAGVCVKVNSDPAALQNELNYQCAKLLREIARG